MTSHGKILLALFLVLGLFGAPVLGQAPPDDLPPLVLPPLPGEEGDVDHDPIPDERPDPPAPPPPLPMPQGPPKVKAGLSQSGTRYFKLLYDGELVGYSSFYVSGEMGLGGQDFIIIKSEGEIRLGMGEVTPSTFFSKLAVKKNTLEPSYYKCAQKAGGGSFLVECVYSETMVAQTNRAGDSKTVHFKNYEKDRVPRLLFNNLWGHLDTFPEHYWLLVRSAIDGGVLEAYDPILRGGGEIIVYEPSSEVWVQGDKKIATKVYPMSDLWGRLLARVRLNAENLELLEVQEVGSGLRMVRTDRGVLAAVQKAKGLDLSSRRIKPSNVMFPSPEGLTSLEAEVEISLRGGQFADHRIPGYRQYFTGELREGYMKGRVVVRSVPREVMYGTKFPLKAEIPEDILPYTLPGPGVESDFSAIEIKGRELAWKSSSTFDAARRIMNFVSQVQEGVSLPSARYALESGIGNPESKAMLTIALARAVGLPARPVGGLLFRDGSFVPHHWVEVWLGPTEGWAPFDPTTAEAGRVGATHLALWESGDVQDLNIKVTDYSPRASRKVPFFNQELNWGVGEKRTYKIMKAGEQIGTEIATIVDLLVEDGQEVYRFVAKSEVTQGDTTKISDGILLVDPHGLPVRSVVTFQEGDRTVEDTFTFLSDTARMVVPGADGEPISRDIPFARGTYLSDPRFLTQWALVIGQTPLPKPNDKDPETQFSLSIFVPGELTSREVILNLTEDEMITGADGEEVSTRKLESESGMIFYLNASNQVVKVAVPEQKLELLLDEVTTDFS